MRELGIIPQEQDARVLADYLLTRNIATRIVANRDGRFGVWVQSEDRLPEARQVYDEFLGDPGDARFQAAGRAAREIRKRAEEIEATHRKQTISLRDRWEGPLYKRAPATFALIAACVVVFLLEQKLYPPIYGWLVFSLQYVSDDGGTIFDSGWAAIRGGQVWRLVTPIFLHANIPHILFNLLALAAFGQRIEMVKGRTRFLGLVLISAIVSNVGQFLLAGGRFMGISGVVFALAGYLWMRGRVAPEEGLGLDAQNAQLMFGWFLLGIIAPVLFPDRHGFPFNMANGAHGVGLAAGLLLGLLRL